ncbi:MAG: hypothetical protein D6805_04590 [Planctomycetota bacterium]|nr:MAG: hypothetical protein D6805_04590 [Planctomycetota bacterium]
MRVWITLFILWNLSIVGCRTTSTSQDPLRKGDEYFAKGDYDKAQQEYEKAAQQSASAKQKYRAELMKAAALDQSNKVDQALLAYSNLIQKYPKAPAPLLMRARLLARTQDYISALRDLNRLFRNYTLPPSFKINALALQGQIKYEQGLTKEAGEILDKALQLANSKTSIKATYHYRRLLYNAAKVQFALENWPRSKELFGEYIRRKRLNGLPLEEEDNYFYALVLQFNGEYAEAEKYKANLSQENQIRFEEEVQKQ